MDIDELKRQWQSMELRVEQLEGDNRRLQSRIIGDRFTGLRGKLLTRYRVMIAVCVISPVWLLLIDDIFEVGTLINICYASFFIITAVCNWRVYSLLRKIDYTSMTVKEVLTATTNMEIMRHRMKRLSWVLAIPLLVMLFYTFYATGNNGLIYGAWVGLALGGIVGTIIDRKTRRIIRSMRQTLANELADDTDG